MLGHTYRFKAQNKTGQTMAIASVVIKARRWKLGTDGSITWEGSEATVHSNAGTIANAAYNGEDTIDNSTDKWMGGTFFIAITAPSSASGDVVIWLELSTDGGTTWPTDGLGIPVSTVNFTTSGTKYTAIEL